MIDLQGKKVLLIAPSFFNYDKEIKRKLEERGASVVLFDDRPSNNSIVKGIIRINSNIIKPVIEKYYKNIIESTKSSDFDIIFFTKGESITVKALKLLKDSFPKAKLVLYLWDSVSNNKNPKIFSYFDRILSFDNNDCKKYGGFIFRPLFYLDYFKEIGKENLTDFTFDLSFIGTVHSDRYFIIKNILKSLSESKYSTYIVMYLPSKMLFWYRKLTEKQFRKVPYSDIEFNPVPFAKVTECFRESKAIIDIQHPGQTGLTMRCIEALGAKKKLITTNRSIIDYDFYDKDNICVIERDEHPNIDFLKTNYKNVSDDIYYKYSIDGWIDDCLNNI